MSLVRWSSLLLIPAAAYQLLAIIAIIRYAKRRVPKDGFTPPVSVLKPVMGLDPNTYDAFRSQARQDYPQYELLFAVADPNDPAIPAIKRVQAEFPRVPIRIIQKTTAAANGKVGALIDLARSAQHPVWVVNDSDIAVTPSYLREVVAPLADEMIGVVTCPYRASAHSAATRWEALGIATDFIPSTMVAQFLGVRDFGLGSTLAFRARDLIQCGGFEALADYLADDYQLGRRITGQDKHALLSTYVVETSLGDGTWRGVWDHQLRWARTIRRSKAQAYVGLPLTQAGLWAAIAGLCGAWPAAAALIGLRIVAAFLAARTLNARQSLPLSWLAPVWDLFAFAIWIGAWTGSTVRWRGRNLRVGADGRIQGVTTPNTPDREETLA